MKTNNETKMKKVSLLRDVFSVDIFSKQIQEIDKDEMIIYERNKLSYTGMNILTILLVVYAICADTFDIKEDISSAILFILGITNYFMLIGFCKTGVVKHSQAQTSLIYTLITLPSAFATLIHIPFSEYKYGGLVMILAIPFAILLYQIANIVYKKSITSDGENDEK